MIYLEHANITVENPDKTAQTMIDLFDWTVRWNGASMNDGYTVHVGNKECYIALYTNEELGSKCGGGNHVGHLNHIGMVVEDLDSIINRAKKLGLEPFNFGEYEPGKRFYLILEEAIEIEIASYKQ